MTQLTEVCFAVQVERDYYDFFIPENDNELSCLDGNGEWVDIELPIGNFEILGTVEKNEIPFECIGVVETKKTPLCILYKNYLTGEFDNSSVYKSFYTLLQSKGIALDQETKYLIIRKIN